MATPKTVVYCWKSAPTPVADKTTDPSHCAESGEHTEATGYQPFTKNRINPAFDEE